jgi:hypothetical protein
MEEIMRFSRVIFAILLITAVALISGCSETKTERTVVISVTMVNASGNNIHILASGEDAAPGNRLGPGQSRTALVTGAVYEVQNLLLGEEVIFTAVALNFYAVRNGVRMAATECDAEQQSDDSWENKTVTYTEDVTPEKNTGSLGCG